MQTFGDISFSPSFPLLTSTPKHSLESTRNEEKGICHFCAALLYNTELRSLPLILEHLQLLRASTNGREPKHPNWPATMG